MAHDDDAGSWPSPGDNSAGRSSMSTDVLVGLGDACGQHTTNMSWRSTVVVCSLIGGLAVATYPIIIAPYLNPRPWNEIQRVGRESIERDKIQPGGMKAWTDPFASKKD